MAMHLSYRSRLRHDLRLWQERGLIEPAQAERIAAEALRAPGLGHLRIGLALCLVLLLAPSIVSFVAANWALLPPAGRLAVLVLADGAAVAAAYAAARRHARRPTPAARSLADAAATLSLVAATASIALVAQTFHLPSDPRGFAGTVAVLGLATALVARSGGAALITVAALAVADSPLLGDAFDGVPDAASWPGFWLVGPALFGASLVGWLPARSATLLLLLGVLAGHLGAVPDLAAFAPDRLFLVALLALALGRALEAWPAAERAAPLRAGGAALVEAAEGLGLVGIAVVAMRTLGMAAAPVGPVAAVDGVLVAAGLALLVRRWRLVGPMPVADLAGLGAVGLSLLAWCAAAALDPGARAGSAFWTVWGGILPALAMVVAGHVAERRALYAWALTLTIVLTVAMLALSSDLLGFSVNLLGCAALVALALAACRWAERRIAGSPS